MVRPAEYPKAIMGRMLTELEIGSIKKHLIAYQKSGDNRSWNDYRKKVDNDLLEKFNAVRIQCRKNGFLYPSVEWGKFKWLQILGTPTDDKCVMCENNKNDGSCAGAIVFSHRGKDFVKCWEVNCDRTVKE